MYQLKQCDLTGSRLIGAITKLGHLGPKHHAIILGESVFDGKVYLAEKNEEGNQIVDYENFHNRFIENGEIRVKPNTGNKTDLEVANNALKNVSNNDDYNLITNNCESFSNQAMHGHRFSGQSILTALGCVALIAGGIWALNRKANA